MFGTESSCKYHHHPPVSSAFVHVYVVFFIYVFVLSAGEKEKEMARFSLLLHPSCPLISPSCFASMVAGGRLHGEKSGIYHFSTEGRHYKLAIHAELTACLAFSHSQPYRVSVWVCVYHLLSVCIFTRLDCNGVLAECCLSVFLCMFVGVSEHVRRWML